MTLASNGSCSGRGIPREVILRSRRVRYLENGLRSVPLETTLAEVERFFLTSGMEAQFHMLAHQADRTRRAFLKFLSPSGPAGDRVFCGKGLTTGQAVASACLEFLERHCAGTRQEDVVLEAPYERVAGEAIDPRLFTLAPDAAFGPAKEIDWVWGYSLTRGRHALVPANLVFCPYETPRNDRDIAWTDSNGLASGNNLEEAVLHGLLEVVERDAVMIGEYNRLPLAGIIPTGLPAECRPTLELLGRDGFLVDFLSVPTDLPFPFVAAFLHRGDDPSDRSVAFGCHLDPALAVSRALTEAIQVLPPSINHDGWLRSDSPGRYAARPAREIRFGDLKNLASSDLKENIERSVAVLKDAGCEIIVVDLSLPDVPFPAVRVLATGLQPLLHEDDRRLSRRFFDVPVKLGFRDRPLEPAEVRIWPLCGYR